MKNIISSNEFKRQNSSSAAILNSLKLDFEMNVIFTEQNMMAPLDLES